MAKSADILKNGDNAAGTRTISKDGPSTYPTNTGPVQLQKGAIIGKRWKIVKKLGEGGCGAVYKVQDIKNAGCQAALKAESNFVAGGTVLKLEVQVLRRLTGLPHVPQLLHAGKKEQYCYMVMTLLGDSLVTLQRKVGRISSISTQTRVGINILFGVKQIHDVGFVHRDLKPANVVVGQANTPAYRFLHILDFGLSREYIVMDESKKLQMRRPRPRTLFRGTTRYCSINTHNKGEQGRVDDLWSVLYILAEMRGTLPWNGLREKKDICEVKTRTTHQKLLGNSPVQLVKFADYLQTLNYYSHPDYAELHRYLMEVMKIGNFKFTDPYDWEPKRCKDPKILREKTATTISTTKDLTQGQTSEIPLTLSTEISPIKKVGKALLAEATIEDPFPAQWFQTNPIGF